MFKIKGERKKYLLNIGSIIQIYDVTDRIWISFEITSIRFEKDSPDVNFWGKPHLGKQQNEVLLVKEHNINHYIEGNILRIVKK